MDLSEDIGLDAAIPLRRSPVHDRYPDFEAVICTKCKTVMGLRDGKFGAFYSCRGCNICLGCYPGTARPRGTQADQETRDLRREVYHLTCDLTETLRKASDSGALPGEIDLDTGEVEDWVDWGTLPTNRAPSFHEVLATVEKEMALKVNCPKLLDSAINYFTAEQCRQARLILLYKLGRTNRYNLEPVV